MHNIYKLYIYIYICTHNNMRLCNVSCHAEAHIQLCVNAVNW